MAPFKLKFRMGSSRSTSQEHEPDPQVNEALLTQHTAGGIGASTSTIDSVDCNSLGNTSERKLLLPNKSNNLRMGYLNQNQATSETNLPPQQQQQQEPPPSPPPTYEFVLEEQRYLTTNDDDTCQNSQTTLLEQFNLNEIPCNDPNCQENYGLQGGNNNESQPQIDRENEGQLYIIPKDNEQRERKLEAGINCNLALNPLSDLEDRKESIDSQEFLLSANNMTDNTVVTDQGEYIENCTDMDCPEYLEATAAAAAAAEAANNYSRCHSRNEGGSGGGGGNNHLQQGGEFPDPLMNYNGYCNDVSHHCDDENSLNEQQHHAWDPNQASCSITHHHNSHMDDEHHHHHRHHHQQQQQHHHHHQQQQQQHSSAAYHTQQPERSLTPEITSNKSSKEIYKDLAKQWGITCKMSDGCRCMECQSHYFDCEFEENEHQKTDGGLGAGTPMFISEVMHGSACNIL
uniref:DUF4802 domain-containing protein n=1 Tax=Glossina palpalis gambiensis TaxID=67801 RepID=A0A1B0BZ54_9MUSC